MTISRTSDPSAYDKDYFENGTVLGISGYFAYRWMPEMTMRMVHHMVTQLPIRRDQTVLDFGCSKGYLVKALRLFDIQAFGVDVSQYAVQHADGEVREFCSCITGTDDRRLFERNYDWLISKDVFEHLPVQQLSILMEQATHKVRNIFAVIPLAHDDTDDINFVIPEYDNDITHVTARTMDWWCSFFRKFGWNVASCSHDFFGCKENWTSKFPDGNGFFQLSRE